MTKEDILDEIQLRIASGVNLPHQAATVGYYIFLLMHKFGLSDDRSILELRSGFIQSLAEWGFEDILENQMRYAMRIADYPAPLETEEIYKVFYLCDEVYGLEQIGLTVRQELKEAYRKSLRCLFFRERRRARIAAEDTVDDWSRNLWWYKENLLPE